MDVTDGESKLRCYKEQYCVGTWNVRSMNQGKLEVVKQEMARVNTDILRISELKWTAVSEFNSAGYWVLSNAFLHQLSLSHRFCPLFC